MNKEINHGGPLPIEDYAMIGDCRSAALVGRNGSIDWLCWPYFDSDACFAALLGSPNHGRWLISPLATEVNVSRHYRGNTMILETLFETTQGRVAIVDFMPVGLDTFAIVRRVEGRGGRVAMHMQLTLRFEYGSLTPWVARLQGESGIEAVGGPNRVVLRSGVPVRGEEKATVARFTIVEGEAVEFALSWNLSHLPMPQAFDTRDALFRTEAFWRDWSERCSYQGMWQQPVLRSLLTLKALSFLPTGALVAAPTTSLPEQLGGSRNWDYRFCWLRDATLALVALMAGGFIKEAAAWRNWLHRAVAGNPDQVQIMYGLRGERRLFEWSPAWLPGYQGASPVRIGNAASSQLQLDTYGEVMSALHVGRHHGLVGTGEAWPMQTKFIEHLEKIWDQPDDGIWEVRGGRRQFTHSKIMAWVAVDCTVRDAETFKMEGPIDRWRKLRDHMHQVICDKGFKKSRNSFTQSFGSSDLDASLLLIPQVGFLPANDPRVIGTVKAIEEDLLVDGFLLRYRTENGTDGLPPGEGAFLPCSFWLASAYRQQGRIEEALALFKRIIAVRNDVGLLSEEYDPHKKHQVGNFPQAYSHLALVATALALDGIDSANVRHA